MRQPRSNLLHGVLSGLCLLLGTNVPAAAEDTPAAERIAWSKDLPAGLAQAKESGRILLVCVNAKRVEGRADDEPAAKGLREVVYLDPRVVRRSRDFVCVLLTPEGSSVDYGELRALGVSGPIVSPQHIFIHPDGSRILHRREYWSYGKGDAAVQALLDMMSQAERGLGAPQAQPAPAVPQGAPDIPKGPDRAPWIADQLERLKTSASERDAALAALVKGDQDGDCTGPLIALLPELKKDDLLLVPLIRALGRNGLEAAALPLCGLLDHAEDAVRANAAVSLEYVGSREKKVVSQLRKAAAREKDEAIANHMFRALGRCGVGDNEARALLLDGAASGKSEFGTYGPCMGLAYFEGDPKAARGVEKLLKQIGVPGSRRGGGQNTVKRGLLSWTLAAIGDKKSAPFVREELIARMEHVKAEWVAGLVTFWEAVANKCDGDLTVMPGIEVGVRLFVEYAKRFDLERYGAETRGLQDEARRGRDTSTFLPKGENLLEDG